MKRLPLFKRPWFATRILEVGGGHSPYQGITHAVDKFPQTNSERGLHDLHIPRGVKFFEGELENLPFLNERFDWIYLSHVFEHVESIEKAVTEINRITEAGYLATPSPLREQVACPFPYDPLGDYHRLFVWSEPGSRYVLNVIQKTQARVGEFCECPDGRVARRIFDLKRQWGLDVEP